MAALPVFIAPEAETDVTQAHAWYLDRAPLSADGFVNELCVVVEAIARNPMQMPPDDAGIHRRSLRRFPYQIYYHTQGTRVTLLGLAHRRRGPLTST
jgi:plasmid stabilization system protein ParE